MAEAPLGRLMVLLVIVTMGALAPAGLASQAAQPLLVEPTGVYGVDRLEAPTLSGGLTASAADLEGGVVYLGGAGYLAAVNASSAALLWATSLQGEAVGVSVDSSAAPQAVAAATSQGEVLVASTSTGSVLSTYYVGQDREISRVLLARAPDGLKLAVHTSDGYLRIYKVGSPYWVEMGPNPGDEPLRSLAGIAIDGIYPVFNVSGWWNQSVDQLILAHYTIVDPDLRPSLAINAYYRNGSTITPAYSYAGLSLGGGRTLYAALEVWVTVEPYGTLEPWNAYPATGNASLTISGLYPGIYRIHAIYNYTIVNTTTGDVLENYCYMASSQPIGLGLADSLEINITLNQSSPCEAPEFDVAILEPLLLVNTTGLPENFTLANLKPILAPKPQGAMSLSDIIAVTLPGQAPPGWSDYNASGIIAGIYSAPDAGALEITFVDKTLSPTPVNGSAHETVQLEAPVSALAYRPDLNVLYLGTGAGTLYRLQWLPAEGRYIATNSMEATGDEPLGSVIPTPWNVTIAIGSQGTAQAVNETSWQPLWRGGPGYPGLTLPLEGAQPIAAYGGPKTPLLVIPSLGAGEAPWILSAARGLWSTPPLSQVSVNVSVVLYTLDGGESPEQPGAGSYVEAYLNGTLVARTQLSDDGTATLYLAPGNYTLLVNATGWGAALVNITVDEAQESIEVTLPFRQVAVTAYTPPGPEPGYSLVAGPVEGANVTLAPVGLDENAGLVPLAQALSLTTGADGTVYTVLWGPVEYNITVAREGYTANTTLLAPGGPANVSLELLPLLYQVTIVAVDSDAASQGLTYTVPGATITIAGPRGEVTIEAPEGNVTVDLPAVPLTLTVAAPGYLANTTTLSPAGSGYVVVELGPETYQVVFDVYINDSLTGLATGPASGALIQVKLVDPPLANFSYTTYTNTQGEALLTLRYGVYNISVEYPGTVPYTGLLRIASGGTISIILRPLYSNTTFTLVDLDLYNYTSVPVGDASILLAYVETGRSLVVAAPNGSASIVLPYGSYLITVQAPFYENYGPAAVNVNRSVEGIQILMKPIYYQVLFNVYINDTLTSLASGPLVGAEVQVVLEDPPVPQVNATIYTDSQGVAVALLRHGVYRVTVSHPYAEAVEFTIGIDGPQGIVVGVEPVYSNVTLEAGDAELYEYGVLAGNASFTLTYLETGRSIVVEASNGRASLVLPYGSYSIAASAPHYYPAGPTEVQVDQPELLETIMLTPVYYQVSIQVTVDDALTGLATGPLAGAQVTAILVEPNVPGVNYTASTDAQGVAVLQLRYGLYQIVVEHPDVETGSLQAEITGDSSLSASVAPKYASVNITLYDSELYQYGVTVSNATLVLTYQATGRSMTLAAPQGVAYATIPYGLYTYAATAPFYYPLGPVGVYISDDGGISDFMVPIKYEVELKFVINDSLWGLATGPAAGALVNLTLESPQLPLPPIADYTDAQGRVVFQLRAGTYQLVVTHQIASTGYFTINVGASESLTFTLHPDYAVLNLTVADGETGKAIPGVTVTLTYTSMGGQRSVSVPLSSGTATLTLPPGSYQLQASEWHYYQETAELTLGKSAAASYTLHMQPVKVPISVYVGSEPVNASGYQLPSRPVGGATIQLEPADPVLQAVDAPVLELESDQAGEASGLVRIGSYVVTVTASHYYGVEAVELITGSRSLSYSLEPVLYNVTLRIVDRELLPGYQDLSGVTLELVSWDGYQVGGQITVDSSDTLRLPAGTLVLAASKEYYETSTVTLEVQGNGNVTIYMNASRYQVAISVTSTFQDWVSGPVVGVNIYLEASEPLKNRVFGGVLDQNGAVQLSLRAGNYTVKLLGPGMEEPRLLGSISVPGEPSVSYQIEAPSANVTLILDDALAVVPVEIDAAVEITYNGPYGSGSLRIVVNGSATISLPAGSLVLTAVADRYKPGSMPLELSVNNTIVRIELEPILAPLKVKVVNPDGQPVDGATVKLTYETPELSPPPIVTVNGTAEVRGGARLGSYRVLVEPPAGSPLLPASTKLDLGEEGASLQVVLPYRNFTVTFMLKDSVTGQLIPFNYTLTITRSGAKAEEQTYTKQVTIAGGKANATLPYGDYIVTLKPAAQDYYVIPQTVAIHVEKDGQEFVISMKPRIYTVSVTVIDDRSRPVAGALVEVIDTKTRAVVSSQLTDSTGSASFNLPYGLYEVRVSHRDYKPASGYIEVPRLTGTTINVYPTPITALKRLAPLIIGVIGLAILGLVLWRAKEAIAARLAEQEEYF